MSRSRLTTLLLVLFAALNVPAQAGRDPTNTGDIGVSIVSVTPWVEYVDTLGPKFTLTGDGALERVVPTRQLTQRVQSLGVIAESSATAVVPAMGEDAPTGLEAASPGIGAAPGSVAVPEGDVQALDPFLQYSAASSLYQEVQLLNRYVVDAAAANDSVPFLVRVQLTHMPYKPNRNRDTYVELGFSACSGTCEDVMVVPLLATENLEKSLGTSLAELRAAAAIVQSVSAPGVAGRNRAQVDAYSGSAVRGQSLNALWTVGSKDGHTLIARIGAYNDDSRRGGRQMVPRTHFLTVLVLVPENVAVSEEEPQAEDKKKKLKRRARNADVSPVPDAFIQVDGKHLYRRPRFPFGTTDPRESAVTSTAAVPPWWDFHFGLCQEEKDEGPPFKDQRLCTFSEPVLVIEGKKSASVTIPGIKLGRASAMSALIDMKTRCSTEILGAGGASEQTVPVRSTNVTYDRDRKLATFTFPPVSKLAGSCKKLPDDPATKKDESKSPKPTFELERVRVYSGALVWSAPAWPKAPPGAQSGMVATHVVYRSLVSPSKDFPIPVERGAGQVLVGRDGTATGLLRLGAHSDKDTAAKAQDVKVSASGADLIVEVAEGASGEASATGKGGEWVVQSGKRVGKTHQVGQYVLRFRNARPGQPITVKLSVKGSDPKVLTWGTIASEP